MTALSAITSANGAERDFALHIEIAKADPTPDGDWIVEGPLSSQRRDLQGERVLLGALVKGLQTFRRMGLPVDYDHQSVLKKSPAFIVGEGVEIFQGPAKDGGTTEWLRTKLFKSKQMAQELWSHKQAGGKLFYSIGGKVLQKRAGKSGPDILDTSISHVALTPYPANPDAEVDVSSLAKSLFGEGGQVPFAAPIDTDPVREQAEGVGEAIGALRKALVPKDPLVGEAIGALRKALSAGSGPGYQSSGARAMVQEDVEGGSPKDTAGPDGGKRGRVKKRRKRASERSRREL